MEEERLSQRDAVDGVVQIIALVQLHLVEEAEQKSASDKSVAEERRRDAEAPPDPPTAWPGAQETSGCSR